jgi:hypothetical protein
MKKTFIFLALLAIISCNARAQFYVIPDTNIVQLVNNFILTGVVASNVHYTGADSTIGHFTSGNLTNLGMNNGIAMTTGTFDTSANPGIGDTVGAFANYYNYGAGDSLLNTLIAPWVTYDASILEFDLIPAGNVLEFQYVFASEEYPEYVGMSFNDVFGFFISGADPAGGTYTNKNIAIIPGTSLPVAINNVNDTTNSAYFINNLLLGGTTIVFDGFTTVLTAQTFVIPSTSYHLKMAIADACDRAFDSGIFLTAQSMKSYFFSGIGEHADNSASIYPNPLNEYSVMELNLKQTGKVVVSIFDHTGRLMGCNESICSQSGNYPLNIGKLMKDYPSGIYMVSLQTPDGNTLEKVVK